ncbi:MAG TPA: DUF4126 domain-containing protein [Gemmatimonadaceae bacterium]|nr:DUF4126 domain-containing protein [Gemmatimonadaceae bacterium]
MLVTVLALAVACGISPYATVALIGLMHRLGWIAGLPPALAGLSNAWVITLAVVLVAVEFAATLVPGIASAWEAAHALLRPPAAIAMALLLSWGGDPGLVLATALLAGGIAFGTSLTKLGARLAIDTSPEPVSNGAANVTELTGVALISAFVWRHPVASAAIALAIVVVTAIVVRTVWGMIWRTVVRSRRPGVSGIRS